MTGALTTHVLDTAHGSPAAGVEVTLCDAAGNEITRGTTNADGRLSDPLLPEGGLEAATYRMRFDTGAYFAASGTAGFYPYVEVVFTITAPAEHYHVPLLLSPFGYSTYRGS